MFIVNKKALQLSGKIPAQGAGGAGSIPAKAPFLKEGKDKEVKEQKEKGNKNIK